jgi:hypothetical protein
MSRELIPPLLGVVVAVAALQGAIGVAVADDVTLTITVVDSDGNPVSNVGFSVAWNGSSDGRTNATTRANGQALVDVPDGSDIEIIIDDEEYIRNTAFTKSNVTQEQIDVPVSLSGTATVTVVDDSGPVSGASVSVSDDIGTVTSLRTDNAGTASTDRIEQGSYDLVVKKSGYLTNRSTVDVSGDTNSTVQIRRSAIAAKFTVVDAFFETPQYIENATITIPKVGTTLTTLSDGTRSTDLPVNREYDVTVIKDGYDTETMTIDVGESDGSYTATLRRTPRLDVTAANNRVVVGESTTVTVTDEYDQPVGGAAVTIANETVGQTDDQGQLTVTIDGPGDITIGVTHGTLSSTVTVEGVETDTAGTAPPIDTPTSEGTTGDSGSGFGFVVTLIAVVGTTVYHWRRGST